MITAFHLTSSIAGTLRHCGHGDEGKITNSAPTARDGQLPVTRGERLAATCTSAAPRSRPISWRALPLEAVGFSPAKVQ